MPITNPGSSSSPRRCSRSNCRHTARGSTRSRRSACKPAAAVGSDSARRSRPGIWRPSRIRSRRPRRRPVHQRPHQRTSPRDVRRARRRRRQTQPGAAEQPAHPRRPRNRRVPTPLRGRPIADGDQLPRPAPRPPASISSVGPRTEPSRAVCRSPWAAPAQPRLSRMPASSHRLQVAAMPIGLPEPIDGPPGAAAVRHPREATLEVRIRHWSEPASSARGAPKGRAALEPLTSTSAGSLRRASPTPAAP
jgi:hypothetical protein